MKLDDRDYVLIFTAAILEPTKRADSYNYHDANLMFDRSVVPWLPYCVKLDSNKFDIIDHKICYADSLIANTLAFNHYGYQIPPFMFFVENTKYDHIYDAVKEFYENEDLDMYDFLSEYNDRLKSTISDYKDFAVTMGIRLASLNSKYAGVDYYAASALPVMIHHTLANLICSKLHKPNLKALIFDKSKEASILEAITLELSENALNTYDELSKHVSIKDISDILSNHCDILFADKFSSENPYNLPELFVILQLNYRLSHKILEEGLGTNNLKFESPLERFIEAYKVCFNIGLHHSDIKLIGEKLSKIVDDVSKKLNA